MIDSLDSINLNFKGSFANVFKKPELIQPFLTKRSNKFDEIIKKEFLRRKLETDFAIVALGGYGRKELFPSSDIDLSIIQFNAKTKKIEDIKDFIGWLWTLKVKVGHSVRTIKDIEKITKSDLKEFTSYLSYRIIFCKKDKIVSLNDDLKKVSKKWNKTKFFKAKQIEQNQRFQSFDSTEFSLEPDLKESPGCLRDFQTAFWILEHCFEIKKLQDCVTTKMFSKKEIASINESYAHIKTLRFFINLESSANRISFENQLLLAKKAKLKASKQSSAVEKFMRTFFLHASNLSDFNELVFQAYDDQLTLLKRPYTKNYYIFKDRLGIADSVDLTKKPELILDSLIQVGKLKKINGLDFKSIRKIQGSLPKIDPKYFLLPEAGAQFLQILKSTTNLSTILKKLKQLGLMRLLIPEFGEIEGQMQFDMFHVYTVDEHTFKVVRNMRQMQIGKENQSMQIEHELINKLPKIELLYLAGIFHDLGKGKGGDHSEIGEKIVERFCKRLNFSIHDTELLCWLVKNHLIMSSISQKTDVHDPETIINFTKNVNTIEKLNYIYMLTINDIRGTNPTLWNSWKHDLLKQLFMSSRRKLNLEEAQSNQSIVNERKVASANAINQGHDLLNEVWGQLPDAYFSKYQLAQLSNQAKTVAASNGKTSVFVNTRKNLIEIFIFTPNQAGLFLKTVRSFEQLSLETIDSDIHTTKDGKYAMNTFICKHKILGGNLIQRDIQNIEVKIINAISSENFKVTAKSKAAYKKVFEYPTRVNVSPSKKRDASLVTIETLDQPNLLSKVANIFLDHGISIDSARITTLGEKVEDNFTVIDEKTKLCISQNKTNQLQKKAKEPLSSAINIKTAYNKHMNNFPLIGLGIATKGTSGNILDAFYPSISFKNGEDEISLMYEKWDALLSEDVTEIKDVAQLDLQDESLKTAIDNLDKNKTLVLCRILDNRPIESIEEAYLKLHLISYKYFLPNSLNLDNLFDSLINVAWTNQGPVELDEIEEKILSAKINNQPLEIKSIDKFPCLTDYIIPPGVRIADASRVRLGAYLSEGTTVMHEGFVNFNAGTLGSAMIEGRISAGVVVGKNSDLGGGCSTMGTLSGGNNVKISIGENCLLGANSGLGIPIGDNCIVEAGLYLTGGSKITTYNSANESGSIVKASELAGQDNLLFIRNSQSGAIEARINSKSVALNQTLHKN